MTRTILSPLTLSLLCPLLTLACDSEDTTEVHHLDDLDEAIDDVTADAEDEARPSLSLTRLNHDCAGPECTQKTVSQWVEMVEDAAPRNWWRFNEAGATATDHGPVPKDGTYLNGAVFQANTPFGGAAKLGTTPWSCVHIGDTTNLGNTWTVETIFAADNTGDPSTSVLVGWASGSEAPGTIKAETWSDTGKMGYTTPWDTTFTPPAAATPTTYKHVVFVGTDGGVSLYVNGVPSGQNPATMQFALGGIGSVSCEENATPSGMFGGLIDELVVYDRALTAAEITAHFGAARSALAGAYECGNGIVQGVEECDNGTGNNTGNLGSGLEFCRQGCTRPVCGDGIKQGAEECDDGNQNNLDSCRNTCTTPKCPELVTSESLFNELTTGLVKDSEGFTKDSSGVPIPTPYYQVSSGLGFEKHAAVTFQSRKQSKQGKEETWSDAIVAYGTEETHMIESAGGGYAGYDALRSNFAAPKRAVGLDVWGPGPFTVNVYTPGEPTKSFEVAESQPFLGVSATACAPGTGSIGSVEIVPKYDENLWLGTNYWNLQKVRWASDKEDFASTTGWSQVPKSALIPDATVSIETDLAASDGSVLALRAPGNDELDGANYAGPGSHAAEAAVGGGALHYGRYEFRVRFAACDADEEMVNGLFTYFNDGTDADADGMADNSEIDIEVLCGEPEYLSLSVWTDYANDNNFRKSTRVINMHTGALKDTPHGVNGYGQLSNAGFLPAVIQADFPKADTYYQLGFTWTPTSVTYFMMVGGVEVELWTLSGASYIPQRPAELRLNLWHSENHWMTEPSGAAYPASDATLRVDWVRFPG